MRYNSSPLITDLEVTFLHIPGNVYFVPLIFMLLQIIPAYTLLVSLYLFCLTYAYKHIWILLKSYLVDS